MAELIITKSNFEDEVTRSDLPVLLDFWASWCAPCMMLSPVVSRIAEKYDGKIRVGKVNVDEEPELARAFGVLSIPMLAVIKGGKVTARSVGYRPMEEIEKLL